MVIIKNISEKLVKVYPGYEYMNDIELNPNCDFKLNNLGFKTARQLIKYKDRIKIYTNDDAVVEKYSTVLPVVKI